MTSVGKCRFVIDIIISRHSVKVNKLRGRMPQKQDIEKNFEKTIDNGMKK